MKTKLNIQSVSRWQEISARRSMEGYLKSQCLTKKSPHGALTKKPTTRQHMPVSYPPCISRIWIKMKYGSFIKKMAEDLATGWENIYPIHIEDVQYVLSIHKYDQAYHKSKRSNEATVTKVICPQRTMIVQPLVMA